MSRDYLTFGDIAGKLEVLRVECTRCPRRGVYNVAKLIEKHGRRGHMMTADGRWRVACDSSASERVRGAETFSAIDALWLGRPRCRRKPTLNGLVQRSDYGKFP